MDLHPAMRTNMRLTVCLLLVRAADQRSIPTYPCQDFVPHTRKRHTTAQPTESGLLNNRRRWRPIQ